MYFNAVCIHLLFLKYRYHKVTFYGCNRKPQVEGKYHKILPILYDVSRNAMHISSYVFISQVTNALDSPSVIRFTKDFDPNDASFNPFNSPSVRVNGGTGKSKYHHIVIIHIIHSFFL